MMPATRERDGADEPAGGSIGCWCLDVTAETDDASDEPLSEREQSLLKAIALAMTSSVHGGCGQAGDGASGQAGDGASGQAGDGASGRLAMLSATLARPAREAYVMARVNGLCEEGAVEIFRDVFASAVTEAPSQHI